MLSAGAKREEINGQFLISDRERGMTMNIESFSKQIRMARAALAWSVRDFARSLSDLRCRPT